MIDWIHKRWTELSLLVLAVISISSLIPLSQLPLIPGSDKTHHVIAYAGLALPIALRGHQIWFGLLCAALVWSGVIELIQPHLNRYGEWGDLLANGLGLVLGTLVGFYLRRFMSHPPSRASKPLM